MSETTGGRPAVPRTRWHPDGVDPTPGGTGPRRRLQVHERATAPVGRPPVGAAPEGGAPLAEGPAELNGAVHLPYLNPERELLLGDVQVGRKSYPTWRLRWHPRTAAEPQDPDTYQLLVPMRGTLRTVWQERQAISTVGDVYAHDMARINACSFEPADDRRLFHAVLVDIPKDSLPLPAGRVERLLGGRVPAEAGVSGLLTGFLRQLTEQESALRPADGPRLGTVLVDLVTALFAHVLDADDLVGPETRQQVLMTRIHSFLRRRLHDPELSPSTVAAAHHISVSYLHRLFREQGTTVSSVIRRQRLANARDDLGDPALRDVSIGRIAARWGFPHAAAFSRLFRAAYAMPPRDYRQLALAAGGPHPAAGRPEGGAATALRAPGSVETAGRAPTGEGGDTGAAAVEAACEQASDLAEAANFGAWWESRGRSL